METCYYRNSVATIEQKQWLILNLQFPHKCYCTRQSNRPKQSINCNQFVPIENIDYKQAAIKSGEACRFTKSV